MTSSPGQNIPKSAAGILAFRSQTPHHVTTVRFSVFLRYAFLWVCTGQHRIPRKTSALRTYDNNTSTAPPTVDIDCMSRYLTLDKKQGNSQRVHIHLHVPFMNVLACRCCDRVCPRLMAPWQHHSSPGPASHGESPEPSQDATRIINFSRKMSTPDL